jgi:putative ferrous iron transport protein C
MSLIAIKQHLMQVKIASLATLCTHFNNASPDVLRDMLGHWMRKGKVRCSAKTLLCGKKCVQCPAEQVEIYEWV